MTSVPGILAAVFAAPGFAVAGAALASIPIIIHILNRRRFKVVKWAAMEYLLQAMRKNRRKLKFEQWLLLVMRCLLIALMGVALARPTGCDNQTIASLGGQRTALHVIVIDNSYSMAYEPGGRPNARTHLDQAKIIARRIVDGLSAGNEAVMVITASSAAESAKNGPDPRAMTPKPTYDLQTARRAIDRIEQSAAGTDLDGAFQLAIRTATEESATPTKKLYVLTDATKSSLEGANGQAVEALKQTGPQLVKQFGEPMFFALGVTGQWNQAVLDVEPVGGLVTTKMLADFRADIKGFGAGPDPVVQWKIGDVNVGNAASAKLDTETRPQTLNSQKIVEGGPKVLSVAIAGDDRLPLDNARWRVVDVSSALKVLVVEGDRGIGALQGSAAFLDLALAPPKEADPDRSSSAGDKSDSEVAPEPPIGELELANKILANYRAVFLTNVGQINPLQADQLQRYVEQGGALIIFVGPSVSGDSYNQNLLPRGLLPGRMIKVMSNLEKPFNFDFNPEGNVHPFLREFKGIPNSGIKNAQVETYWQVELPANTNATRVLDYLPPAGAEAGAPRDPAITEHTLGRGRVVFVSTSANPDWHKINPKGGLFVTLIHEILAGSVGTADNWMNLVVGETLKIPQSMGLTAAPTLLDSAKNPVVMESQTNEAGVTTYRGARPMTKPGIYTLSVGNRSMPIAVNVPPAEADVRVVSHDAVAKALGDIKIAFEDDRQAAAAGLKVESGNDWSWIVMAIVFALAGFECFCAMRFGHYRRGKRTASDAPEGATAAAA